MRPFPLRLLFYIGLAFFIIGVLFKIQHWLYASWFLLAGVLFEISFFIFLLLEIFLSKKASITTKLIWAIPIVLIPVFAYFYVTQLLFLMILFFTGNRYFVSGRHRFLFMKNDKDNIHFDSI